MFLFLTAVYTCKEQCCKVQYWYTRNKRKIIFPTTLMLIRCVSYSMRWFLIRLIHYCIFIHFWEFTNGWKTDNYWSFKNAAAPRSSSGTFWVPISNESILSHQSVLIVSTCRNRRISNKPRQKCRSAGEEEAGTPTFHFWVEYREHSSEKKITKYTKTRLTANWKEHGEHAHRVSACLNTVLT